MCRYICSAQLLIVLALLFASDCVAAQPVAQQKSQIILPEGTLDAEQVTDLFAGNTVESVTAVRGRVSLSFYALDGTVRQTRNGQSRSGTWRVRTDGRICLRMEALREKCRIIVIDGDVYKKYIVRKNGQHQHSVTYRQFWSGNPFGL
jgi:hypothetical protein